MRCLPNDPIIRRCCIILACCWPAQIVLMKRSPNFKTRLLLIPTMSRRCGVGRRPCNRQGVMKKRLRPMVGSLPSSLNITVPSWLWLNYGCGLRNVIERWISSPGRWICGAVKTGWGGWIHRWRLPRKPSCFTTLSSFDISQHRNAIANESTPWHGPMNSR